MHRPRRPIRRTLRRALALVLLTGSGFALLPASPASARDCVDIYPQPDYGLTACTPWQ